MIEIKNLNKNYKNNKIFQSLNYILPNTGLIMLVGKTGIGKSTFLNLVSGTDDKYDGDIKYSWDYDISKDCFYNKYKDNLITYFTVLENLEFILNNDEYCKALEYVDKFDLKYLLNKKSSVISSGEKQKIAIIMALCRRARITLLDEPTCNIDQESRWLFIEEIKKLSEEVLVLYVTHDEDEGIYADEIIRIVNYDFVVESKNCFSKEVSNKIDEIDKKSFLYIPKRKPKIVKVLTYLTSYFFFTIMLFMLDFILTTDDKIYSNVFSKTNINLVYSNNSDLINYDCISNYDIIEESIFFDIQSGYCETLTKKIVVTDEIFIGNKIVKLDTNQVYISDYLYDCALDECGGSDQYPKRHKYKSIFASSFNRRQMNVEVIPYITNYSDYIPNVDSEDYGLQKQKFKKMVDDYYSIIFMTNELYCQIQTEEAHHSEKNFHLKDDFIEVLDNQLEPTGEKIVLESKNDIFISVGDFVRYFGYKESEFFENRVELIEKHKGETITITFNSARKSISKDLVFKGVSQHSGNLIQKKWDIIITPELYEEIYEELELDMYYNWNEFDTIFYCDINKSDFADFAVNETYSVEKIEELNRMLDIKHSMNPVVYGCFGTCLFIYIAIIAVYLRFYSLKQYSALYNVLAVKGFKKEEIIKLNYLFSLILNIILICISLIVFIIFRIPVKKFFKIYM